MASHPGVQQERLPCQLGYLRCGDAMLLMLWRGCFFPGQFGLHVSCEILIVRSQVFQKKSISSAVQYTRTVHSGQNRLYLDTPPP